MRRDSKYLRKPRQHHTQADVVRMALLYVAGMTAPELAALYGCSDEAMKTRIRQLYARLDCNRKLELMWRLTEQGYLEHMYLLMRLINAGEHDAAVELARQIEID